MVAKAKIAESFRPRASAIRWTWAFGAGERTEASSAKPNAAQALENTQSRETGTFRAPMISMTYDPHRETDRFASRNIRFVLPFQAFDNGPVAAPLRVLGRLGDGGVWTQAACKLVAGTVNEGGKSRAKECQKPEIIHARKLVRAFPPSRNTALRKPSPSSASSWSCDPSATDRRSRLQIRP
jgi:hypothetical protein